MSGKHRAPRKAENRSARVVETSDLVGALTRMAIAYGERIGQDPAGLVHLRELTSTLEQQANRGIFLANRGQDHYSQNDIARILGLTRQAIAHRIRLGELAQAELTERRGGGAVIRLGELRARRARLLEQAGLEDRTGTDRERYPLRAAGQ